MKKLMVLFFALVCLLGAAGCASNKIDRTTPVFETENISQLTFIAYPNAPNGINVPDVYLEEITVWLGTFRIDEKADSEILAPGSDSISVRIKYEDGTVVENGLTTVTIDGTVYYMESAPAPECYFEIFSGKE